MGMNRRRLGLRPLLLLMPLLMVKCSGDDYSIGGPNQGGGASGGAAGNLEGGSGGFTGGRSSGASGAASGAAAGSDEPGVGGGADAGGQAGASAGSHQGGGGASGGGGRDDGGGGEPPGHGGGGAPSGGAGAPACGHTVAARCLGFTQEPIEGVGTEAVAMLESVEEIAAINRHNQMVGSARTDCGVVSAFMYQDGQIHSLLERVDHARSWAVDVNDRGVVVGEVILETALGTHPSFPFIWDNGVLEVLTELPEHQVVAINNRDQILLQATRVADDGQLEPAGLLWEAGALTQLGPAPGRQGLHPHDLNESGQVVGSLRTGSLTSIGFLWDDGVIQEIPALQAATAINDAGLIAGSSAATTQWAPAIWDGANLVVFGARNDDAPVWLGDDGSVLGPGYVYIDGVLSRLSVNVRSAWHIIEAREMNDNRIIVGRVEVVVVTSNPGGCRFESCESSSYHGTVWSPECFGACCGEAEGGAGGGGGGMGETESR